MPSLAILALCQMAGNAMEKQHSNRLAAESSPYLLQHADNPVDWYPWGQEAFETARRLDKPIFLSIGYSACHWCHVMEHESFEDAGIAAVLNRDFIAIKVDREERPDVDAVYMKAVQLMIGGGGWPLSVFLTPTLKPFFGGTYCPARASLGQPGFKDLLIHLAKAYKSDKAQIGKDADGVASRLTQWTNQSPRGNSLDPLAVSAAAASIASGLDPVNGGYGGAPKFPQPSILEFMLSVTAGLSPVAPASRTFSSGKNAAELVLLTLDKMAAGGIYDQIGGGFHRYSTDERWFAPHFEKMLYDNAQLARLYTAAWQLTGRARYREIARETLDYILREMTSPEGGFYSSQDADSEGREGRFYAWEWKDIVSALDGDERAVTAVANALALTKSGNWEDGLNILTRVDSTADRGLGGARGKLFDWRARNRVAPARDEKILTDWNALTIETLAYAGAAFKEPRYTQAAVAAAGRIATERYGDDGVLLHALAGGRKVPGFLEDYAFWANALIGLYETTLDISYLESARAVAGKTLELFYDQQAGAFYSFPVKGGDADLLTNVIEVHDGVVPSGVSSAVTAL
ncbi:MAG: thioredoxin domain-containing protein, partial [Elusimicrobiota bacterium]